MNAFTPSEWHGLGMSEADRTRLELYTLSHIISAKSKTTASQKQAISAAQKPKIDKR